MKTLARVIALTVFAVVHAEASAPKVEPAKSSADVIRYARAAEADPLTATASMQRKAAMKFAENDHSTHVLLCGNLFTPMTSNNGANSHEISLQYIISAAAALYEHPEIAPDSHAQNVAGIEAALNVYEKFLASNSGTRSVFLDQLDQHKKDGTLGAHLRQVCK